MDSYGETFYENKLITLDSVADFTNRLMPFLPYHEAREGDRYCFEVSASGHDEDKNKCTVYWEFEAVKGAELELDAYDYTLATRVVFD